MFILMFDEFDEDKCYFFSSIWKNITSETGLNPFLFLICFFFGLHTVLGPIRAETLSKILIRIDAFVCTQLYQTNLIPQYFNIYHHF